MATLKTLALWYVTLVVLHVGGVLPLEDNSTECIEIITENGLDVVLPCTYVKPQNISSVLWLRSDLGAKDVMSYRDGKMHTEDQHPSFTERVDLQDRQMRNGTVSMVLKNTTFSDNGLYKCNVLGQVTRSWEHIVNVNLTVLGE